GRGMNRRDFLATATAAAAVTGVVGARGATGTTAGVATGIASASVVRAGRLKQSVCQWGFSKMPVDDLCREAAAIGLVSVELLGPKDWETAKKHGLTCALAAQVNANPIHKGWNRVENHDAIVKDLEERLPLCKAAGVPQQIVF